MRVITLNKETFKTKCRELRTKFEAEYGVPALTVGIARGGEYVARAFTDVLEPLAIIERRRPGSESKDKHASGIVQRLPGKATDLLRMLESGIYHLCWVADGRKPVKPVPVSLPSELRHKLKNVLPGETIALVDDAADSGETILSVKEAIRLVVPEAKIVTAVLTVTRRQADPTADVALWRDNTLVRFPWSPDYRD